MRTIGWPGKKICTLSSHRATRELYAIGAQCEGSMRIELRSELYAKGALCEGSSMRLYSACSNRSCFAEPHRAPFA